MGNEHAVTPPKGPQLADKAESLGFAGQIPADVELYTGSVGAKAHLDALHQTRFYQELSALIEKNKTAGSPGDKGLAVLQSLLGDDFFVAGATGTSAFVTWFKEFGLLQNELQIRAQSKAAMSAKGQSDVLSYLEPLLQQPAQLERVQKLVSQFELPPILAGIKVANPEAISKELFPSEDIAKLPPDLVTVSTFKVQDGTEFQMLSTDVSRLIPEERKQALLKGLPANFTAESKAALERMLDSLQGKKLCFAWAVRGDYLLVAFGKNLDHVRFAATPATSLLAKSEMAQLLPLADKKLMLLSYGSQVLMDVIANKQPLTPLLRAVISGLKDTPELAPVAARLEGSLPEYTKLEESVFTRATTPQVGALWWEQGLKGESFGGFKSTDFVPDVPLQFARFVNQPDTLLGFAYRYNTAYESARSAWVEKLVEMIYSGVQGVLKKSDAGMASAQVAMFESMALPALLEVYGAQREMSQKAFGADTAFVLDTKGKMPALPGVPPQTKGLPFPRLTTFSEVVSRPALTAGWDKINAAIAKSATVFAGGATAGNTPGAPAASPIPEPISSDKNGVTSYFFGIPFFSGDLLPCASVNDHLFMLSTSKNAAEAYASELAQPDASPTNGFVWTINPGGLIEYAATTGSAFASEKSPKQEEDLKQLLRWTAPFQAIHGRTFEENKVSRRSFAWDITDLK